MPTSSPSPRRSTRISKWRKSIAGSLPPTGRRCSSPTSRGGRSRWSPTCSAPHGAPTLAFGERPLRAHQAPGGPGRDHPAADAGKLWGARDVGREPAQGRPQAPVERAGHRGGDADAAARPAAGDDLLAGGRRPVRDAAAGLHRSTRTAAATTSACTACRSTIATSTGMHWQIGKGGGFHYQLAEARGPAAAGHGVSRRPAGADPVGDRAAARERARADAGVAHRRRAAGARARPVRPSAPAGRQRRVRADRRGGAARAPARRAVRRSLRLLLAAARLPGVRRPHRWRTVATRSIRRRWSASRGRRTSSSATCCRSCCRRSSRW